MFQCQPGHTANARIDGNYVNWGYANSNNDDDVTDYF